MGAGLIAAALAPALEHHELQELLVKISIYLDRIVRGEHPAHAS